MCCCCCHCAGAGAGGVVIGWCGRTGIVVLTWTLCHCGPVIHTGHRRVVVVALSTLLLGHPGGCGGGCVINAHPHQVAVAARRRWWVVQGVMVVSSACGVWHGHGWVVDAADPGHPGGQTPVIIS